MHLFLCLIPIPCPDFENVIVSMIWNLFLTVVWLLHGQTLSHYVGGGPHSPHFLEILDVPTFYRPIGKTKVLNYSFNQFVYNFYSQSILILEEYLEK